MVFIVFIFPCATVVLLGFVVYAIFFGGLTAKILVALGIVGQLFIWLNTNKRQRQKEQIQAHQKFMALEEAQEQRGRPIQLQAHQTTHDRARTQLRLDEISRRIAARKPVHLEIKKQIKRAVREAFKDQHDKLLIRYLQLTHHDAYGRMNSEAWAREAEYFVRNYVVEKMENANIRDINFAIEELTKIVEHNSAKVNNKACPTGDGKSYERLCAQTLEAAGWHARLTQTSGDQGIDIIAERGEFKVVIQCKNHSKPVGNRAVQEASAGKSFESANAAVVVCPSGYTKAAKQLAKRANVLLLHESELANLAGMLGL